MNIKDKNVLFTIEWVSGAPLTLSPYPSGPAPTDTTLFSPDTCEPWPRATEPEEFSIPAHPPIATLCCELSTSALLPMATPYFDSA